MPGKRFMSMIVIDEDHYVPEVVYGAGHLYLTKEQIGTRYVFTSVRTLVDPANPEDLKQVHALQDAIKVKQPGGPGRFEVPNWDPASQKKVRDVLKAFGESLPDWNGAAGPKDQVDPVRHLIVTATGWGLNPEKDAIYLNVTPAKNDGTTRYRAHGEGRARRRLLVDQRLQRRGLLREERVRRVHAQQHHGQEGSGRVGHDSVRRLRRQDAELPADHDGLELHGAPVSAAAGDLEWHVEVSRGAAPRVAAATENENCVETV